MNNATGSSWRKVKKRRQKNSLSTCLPLLVIDKYEKFAFIHSHSTDMGIQPTLRLWLTNVMIERLYRVSKMSRDSCRTLTRRHKCVNTLNETSYISSEGLRDLAEFFFRYSYRGIFSGVESESYLRNKASIFHSILRSFWLDLNISSLFMRKQRSDG